MELWLQQLVNGLVLGGMLALMSVGLSLIFGLLKTANFAYGALYMVGGYCAYWAAELLHIPYGVALPVAFIVMFFVGAAVERFGFETLRGNEEATLIFGLALALVIRGLAIILWGSQSRFLNAPVSGSFHLSWLTVSRVRVLACVGSLCIIAVLFAVVKYTRWGRIIRAVADNPERAGLLGLNVRTHTGVVFGLGTGLSALACVLLIPVYSLSPTVDNNALYTGFTVVILGGLGSIPGCVVAAMIIGLVSTFAVMLTNSQIAPAFPLLVLLLTLLLKPEGLFGKKGRLA